VRHGRRRGRGLAGRLLLVAMPARRAVARGAALGGGQVLYLDEPGVLDALHHELGDPVAAAAPDRGARIEVDEGDADLAAVARVDGARRVDDGEAAPRGQARTGVHE